MHSTPAISASHHARRINPFQQLREILLQKLWLPRVIYEALPYLYLVMGLTALVSAAYLPGWNWLLPYAILFSLACLHVSLAIIALRYNARCKSSAGRGNGDDYSDEDYPASEGRG